MTHPLAQSASSLDQMAPMPGAPDGPALPRLPRAVALEAVGHLHEALRVAMADGTADAWATEAHRANAWFTPTSVRQALEGVIAMTAPGPLSTWIAAYPDPLDKATDAAPRAWQVGIVAAGNLPLVSFQDVLMTVLAGHQVQIKMASQDAVMPARVLAHWGQVAPALAPYLTIVDRLVAPEAILATGSTNTGRYFEEFFGRYPNLIRRGRTSVAVLRGDETHAELEALAGAMLDYFGQGCRSVTGLLVPEGWQPDTLRPALTAHESLAHHHKYACNLEYRRALMMMAIEPFADLGVVLMRLGVALPPPIGVVGYEAYTDEAHLEALLATMAPHLQVVTSAGGRYPGSVDFAAAQCPGPGDFADGLDTLAFLLSLD